MKCLLYKDQKVCAAKLTFLSSFLVRKSKLKKCEYHENVLQQS